MVYETALNFLKRERKELKGRSTVLSEWLQVVRGIGSPTREDHLFTAMGIKKGFVPRKEVT